MAFLEKKYVDLAGLTTFSTSLKNKLKANSVSDWVVNYASIAGKATADEKGANIVATYLTKSDATATYVPLSKTIAGLALSTDITASALRTQLNVEDGSEKNKIVAIKIDNVEQSIGSDRSVTLDLSNYAKKTDITAVLKFMGVVSDINDLNTNHPASADQVGHVWIVASGSDKDAYAEYVCVDNGESASADKRYTWEKLGNGASLDGYYTQEQIDDKFTALSLASTGAEGSFISTISQTAGKVSASATEFATSVAENGKVAPTSGAVYTAIEGAKSALIGIGAGDSGSTIKKNEAAIATLNGADTVEGSVNKKIKDAIGALDYTEVNGDYVTSVTQTDGKIAVVKGTKGEVEANNEGLVDGGTVHTFVTSHVATAIQGLDAKEVGGAGKFIQAIGETDGKISATVKTLDATIPDSNPSTVVAPTTSAFKDYSDSVYVAISSVSSEEISQLFILNLVSKTRDLISRTIKVAESDSVTSIADYVFTECSSLTSVSFPVATSIGQYAFNGCSKLTEVSFPNVTSIGNSAFDSCRSLTKVSFPLVTSIGSSEFYECSALTSVSIPNATSIGDYAFQNCSKLTEVSFPLVTSIGSAAFENCSGLTSVSLPKATSIGYGTFRGCSSLTTIYVGTDTSTICTLSSTNAFDNCTNLTNIYVPSSLVDRYKSATNWSRFASKIKATS